jgi:hypothetical protein
MNGSTPPQKQALVKISYEEVRRELYKDLRRQPTKTEIEEYQATIEAYDPNIPPPVAHIPPPTPRIKRVSQLNKQHKRTLTLEELEEIDPSTVSFSDLPKFEHYDSHLLLEQLQAIEAENQVLVLHV